MAATGAQADTGTESGVPVGSPVTPNSSGRPTAELKRRFVQARASRAKPKAA